MCTINTEPSTIKTWCGAAVDAEQNLVSNDKGSVELTKNEMFILKQLIEQKSREELIRSLWNDERFVSDNTLTVNVNRLRKKLDALQLGAYIETKVGQGYIAKEEDKFYD